MVSIWLQDDAGEASSRSAADTSGGAEQFKDLVKMQDRELQGLRASVEKLQKENERLQKLTTDEDKTLLVWKVEALTKQCEELQSRCDNLDVHRSKSEVERLRERQRHRKYR